MDKINTDELLLDMSKELDVLMKSDWGQINEMKQRTKG